MNLPFKEILRKLNMFEYLNGDWDYFPKKYHRNFKTKKHNNPSQRVHHTRKVGRTHVSTTASQGKKQKLLEPSDVCPGDFVPQPRLGE